MTRLSASLDELEPHYTAIVIGSGYGGGVAASRLARAGQHVCVLERGREIRPGEYPDTWEAGAGEMQFNTPEGHVGSATGMVEVHVNEGQNVLVGCGLGGTSLINANVSLEPVRAVWRKDVWPNALVDDLDGGLAAGYERARAMLQPSPYPADYPALDKLEALDEQARALGWGDQFYRPPINVTFEDGENAVGVMQKACVGCGDCCSGCNYGAKNTTLMNYLPDAWNFGAQIFTQVRVSHITRGDGVWQVHCQLLGLGREDFDAPELVLTADIVCLGAGTVGTTEILLRSKAYGLPLSDQVGHHMSGNGDVLAFGYNCDRPINAVGFGDAEPGERKPTGPCITGIIDHRDVEPVDQGFVIEEGVAPGLLSGWLGNALAVGAATIGDPGERDLGEWLGDTWRKVESLVTDDRAGATYNTQVYLGMAHDHAPGTAHLADGRIRIEAPDVGEQPIFERVNDTLNEATQALDGTFVRDPIWTEPLDKSLISVHPLGGARMAADASGGAVTHDGRVFAGTSGTTLHEGLLVTDGAVMPMALGVNPLLTISALAERSMARLAERHGWHVDWTLPVRQTREPAERPPGLRFTETMKGHVAVDDGQTFAAAEEAGLRAGQRMRFTLTVLARDVNALLDSPEHPATLIGTVTCPLLEDEPMTLSGGRFNLFTEAEGEVLTRYMRYRGCLHARSGRTYFLDGYKRIIVDSPDEAWHQTTTLYTTIHDGRDGDAPPAARGILHVPPADFAKQLTTMRVVGADDTATRLATLARFGRYFASVLWDMYGGIAHGYNYYDPETAPQPSRALRAGEPEHHPFRTSDGVELLLTRYRGGDKGPLMMVHGAAVSSEIFSTRLVGTNLLEYFHDAGYDVWLLDWRMSIALPASRTQFDLDTVAAEDFQPAIDLVRQQTGAADVQCLVHCLGSVAFFMSLLDGLTGVRSVAASQVATHTVTPALSRVKAHLHLATLLDQLGVDTLTARTSTESGLMAKLFDQVLKLQPELGKDNDTYSPINHRLNFMFGGLFEVHNLPELLYENLHELFGLANLETFRHMAALARAEHLVSFEGEDTYLPHLDRLKLPILLFSGSENATWLPVSTQRAFEALEATNGPGYYRREVVDGYGHLDTIFGKNAYQDVFPLIREHFDASA